MNQDGVPGPSRHVSLPGGGHGMGKNSRIGFGVIKAGFRCRKMLLQEGMSSWASLENHLRSRSGVNGESCFRPALNQGRGEASVSLFLLIGPSLKGERRGDAGRTEGVGV